jgi:hypothetical protein
LRARLARAAEGPQPGDVFAVQPHSPGLGPKDAGDQVEGGGFSRAVRPDQTGDRPFAQVDVQAVNGLDPSECAHQAAGFEDNTRRGIGVLHLIGGGIQGNHAPALPCRDDIPGRCESFSR